MNYHHFTIEERCCLREYYVKGKPFESESRNIKKEPGVNQRQAQESFALPNSARFI